MLIDANASGHDIALRVGEAAEIRLAENPTTGFRWAVLSDGAPACRLDDAGYKAAGERPGQGGEHGWRLVGAAAGRCELRLVYRRAFEAAGPDARAFALRVRVK